MNNTEQSTLEVQQDYSCIENLSVKKNSLGSQSIVIIYQRDSNHQIPYWRYLYLVPRESRESLYSLRERYIARLKPVL